MQAKDSDQEEEEEEDNINYFYKVALINFYWLFKKNGCSIMQR